jgi:hypothetical protein
MCKSRPKGALLLTVAIARKFAGVPSRAWLAMLRSAIVEVGVRGALRVDRSGVEVEVAISRLSVWIVLMSWRSMVEGSWRVLGVRIGLSRSLG